MDLNSAPTFRLLAGLAVTLCAVAIYSGYTILQLGTARFARPIPAYTREWGVRAAARIEPDRPSSSSCLHRPEKRLLFYGSVLHEGVLFV